MRYVTVPNPVTLLDPVTDEPVKDEQGKTLTRTFAWACRLAIAAVAAKGAADSTKVFDVRRKTDTATPGKTLVLDDDDWELLAPEFRRVNAQLFGLPWALCAEDHIRAILDAPTKPPAVFVASAEQAAS